MSVLSGEAIRKALAPETPNDQRLIITPFFDPEEQIDLGAASVDLRLGCRFSATKRRQISVLPAYSQEVHPRQLVDEYYVPLGTPFVLHPQHFVLGTTLEWIRLPACLAGYVLGRSTHGRRGLVIATATGVHPGYSGVLTLELTNVGEIPIEIVPGQAICQLFLHDVKEWEEQNVDLSSFLGSLHPSLGVLKPDKITEFFDSLKRP
jgi:dCTP deaminase